MRISPASTPAIALNRPPRSRLPRSVAARKSRSVGRRPVNLRVRSWQRTSAAGLDESRRLPAGPEAGREHHDHVLQPRDSSDIRHWRSASLSWCLRITSLIFADGRLAGALAANRACAARSRASPVSSGRRQPTELADDHHLA